VARVLVGSRIKEFGKLDILVNVAGILRDRMIFNMTIDEWDGGGPVHLRGHFCTMRPASAHMRERKFGASLIFRQTRPAGARPDSRITAAPRLYPRTHLQRRCQLAKIWNHVNANSCAVPPPDDRHNSGGPPARHTPGERGGHRHSDGPGPNVPPIIVFLASDEAAAVTAIASGASGYRITRYTHIEPDRILYSNGPWDIDSPLQDLQIDAGERDAAAANVASGHSVDVLTMATLTPLPVCNQPLLREGAQDSPTFKGLDYRVVEVDYLERKELILASGPIDGAGAERWRPCENRRRFGSDRARLTSFIPTDDISGEWRGIHLALARYFDGEFEDALFRAVLPDAIAHLRAPGPRSRGLLSIERERKQGAGFCDETIRQSPRHLGAEHRGTAGSARRYPAERAFLLAESATRISHYTAS